MEIETQLFEATEDGRRRSILFAIVVASGAVCVSTATIALLAPPGAPAVGIAFGLLGAVLIAVAGHIQQGGLGMLFTDNQLLWRL